MGNLDVVEGQWLEDLAVLPLLPPHLGQPLNAHPFGGHDATPAPLLQVQREPHGHDDFPVRTEWTEVASEEVEDRHGDAGTI